MTPEDAVEKLLEHGKMIELAVPVSYGLWRLCRVQDCPPDRHLYRLGVAILCSMNNMNMDSHEAAYIGAMRAVDMERKQPK